MGSKILREALAQERILFPGGWESVQSFRGKTAVFRYAAEKREVVRSIFLRLARKQKERKTIGFYGVGPGVGTTHLAIAAAHYAVNEWGVPAAVAELGSRPCLRDLDSRGEGAEHFVIDGVGYFPQMEPAQMPQLLNSAY